MTPSQLLASGLPKSAQKAASLASPNIESQEFLCGYYRIMSIQVADNEACMLCDATCRG